MIFGGLNILGQGFSKGFNKLDIGSVAIDTFTGAIYGALSGRASGATIGTKIAIAVGKF